jgi:hypothetical protein
MSVAVHPMNTVNSTPDFLVQPQVHVTHAQARVPKSLPRCVDATRRITQMNARLMRLGSIFHMTVIVIVAILVAGVSNGANPVGQLQDLRMSVCHVVRCAETFNASAFKSSGFIESRAIRQNSALVFFDAREKRSAFRRQHF